ncbi:abscisic stress-ripening protein 1-like [Ananas comosus]|uniref:Abscisic stress-ripening protein 1-like n=1 Tax=Ananas comosus TaxID=4615 RepID=A0A6P5ELX9_ANACO|nr:abscisic stress-ripening protein 1-like [Ananas comosus]
MSEEKDYEKEEKHHKHLELLGELGAVAAGAFALPQYEGHKARTDPKHAHRHRLEEEIAETVALACAGFALHEHHEKNKAKKHQN